MSVFDEARIHWLWLELVEDIHASSLRAWGGAHGIREPSQLQANLNRPKAHFDYGEKRIPALGAWYVIAFCRTQCFVDGNKRTALWTGMTFLDFNGHRAVQDSDEIWRTVLGLSNGSVSETDFIKWFVSISSPR